jgi:hypothetical protein
MRRGSFVPDMVWRLLANHLNVRDRVQVHSNNNSGLTGVTRTTGVFAGRVERRLDRASRKSSAMRGSFAWTAHRRYDWAEVMVELVLNPPGEGQLPRWSHQPSATNAHVSDVAGADRIALTHPDWWTKRKPCDGLAVSTTNGGFGRHADNW